MALAPFGTSGEENDDRVSIWGSHDLASSGRTLAASFFSQQGDVRSMTPSRKLFAAALPSLVVLAGVGGMSLGLGCARSATEEASQATALAPERSAQLAVAFTKGSPSEDRQGARSVRDVPGRSKGLANLGSTPFFSGLATRTLNGLNVAETPLEMLLGDGDRPLMNNGLCPPDMASIDDRYCVDRFEDSLLELLPSGEERPFSSYESLEGHRVRAVSEADVFPRGYISGTQAAEACSLSGKRLCKPAEWRNACMGPQHVTYGYAPQSEPGRCNDHGRSPMGVLYAGENLGERDRWDWDRMNRPELNQVDGTLARSGSHPGCTNDYGVYDMVGNLHEWVADPEGTFQGGYYLDTQINGEGCTYRTTAHAVWYHDYSTGFRCCADVAQ
jgi:sulfatase modifying factor 1